MKKRRIISLHWNNVDRRIVRCQEAVFRSLGLSVEQHCRNRLKHGIFLDEMMQDLDDDTTALFVDIDCIPLNAAIVEEAFQFAEAGGIFGCAQTANHIDPLDIYISPVFMAISRRTWNELGRPSFKSSAMADVAQKVHAIALEAKRQTKFLFPEACLIPRWKLADKTYFGIGTFYEGGVFHLFESRHASYSPLFVEVADAVVAKTKPDFLALSHRAMMRYPLSVVLERARKLRKTKITPQSLRSAFQRRLRNT